MLKFFQQMSTLLLLSTGFSVFTMQTGCNASVSFSLAAFLVCGDYRRLLPTALMLYPLGGTLSL